jgi:WD40 repeat protein
LLLWDAGSCQQLAVLEGHAHAVYSCAFSPDGARIVSASADKTVRAREATSGEQRAVLIRDSPVNCCAFHATGSRLCVGDERGLSPIVIELRGEAQLRPR